MVGNQCHEILLRLGPIFYFSCLPSHAFFKHLLSCYYAKYGALEASQSNEGDLEEYKYSVIG